MKGKLTIQGSEVEKFLKAVLIIMQIASHDIKHIDCFTAEEIEGFEILSHFLTPLIKSIHDTIDESTKSIVDSVKAGENNGT